MNGRTPNRYRPGVMTVLLIALLATDPGGSARAGPPALPSSFWGEVTLADGSAAPTGLAIWAIVGDGMRVEALTRPYEDLTIYTLHVPADDSDLAGLQGGREGDAVHWQVCGEALATSSTWHGGTNVRLDLQLPTGADCIAPTEETSPALVIREPASETEFARATTFPGSPAAEQDRDGAQETAASQDTAVRVVVAAILAAAAVSLGIWRKARSG